MGESETEKRLKALVEIERDLLRAVEITGAEFHASVNGDRKDAAATFATALRYFNRFIIDGLTPEAEVSVRQEVVHEIPREEV